MLTDEAEYNETIAVLHWDLIVPYLHRVLGEPFTIQAVELGQDLDLVRAVSRLFYHEEYDTIVELVAERLNSQQLADWEDDNAIFE